MSDFPNSIRLSAPVRITDQVWPEGTVPVVSVFCITYNHVNFIRDAIEGFLMQETTFPVEIFIHDDASTDGTAEIVKEYAEKYPNLFWTVLQTENQWSKGNKKILTDYLQKQRGEYIALCEGDDYWIAKEKLQKQVSFFDDNQNFALIFCNVRVKYYDQKIPHLGYSNEILPDLYYQPIKIPDEVSTIDTLACGNFIHTPGVLFKNWIKTEYEIPYDFLCKCPTGDWALHMVTARFGEIKYFSDVMATYRVHPGGVFSSLDSIARIKTEILISYYASIYWKYDKKYVSKWFEVSISRMLDLFYYSESFKIDDELKELFSDPIWCEKFLSSIHSLNMQDKKNLHQQFNSYENSLSLKLGRMILRPFRILNKFVKNKRIK